jgi:predicted transcriptional regulator
VQPETKTNFISFSKNKSTSYSAPKKKPIKNFQIHKTNEIFMLNVQCLLQFTERLFIILHSRLVMSSKKSKNSENFSFVERFIEVCGSSQPTDITRLLNISYQAAKNYLNGRLPEAKILKTISEKTPYSINWLLTGEGEKFVKTSLNEDTLILSDQMRAFVRQICMEVIGEVLNDQSDQTQPKTVVLTSDKIKEEKVSSPSVVFSENESK